VVLAVGACSGGDDPPPSSSTTSGSSSSSSTPTTTTSSPSTTATATVKVPAVAQKHTPEGAEAFVRFFVEQSNDAWTRPDDTLLPPISDPGCVACRGLQSTAEELVAKKQHYVSAPVTDIRTTAVDGAKPGQQMVRLLAKQNMVQVLDASGTVVRTDPAMDLARTVLVTWGDGQWRVFDAQ
jgi:hypothetical protein